MKKVRIGVGAGFSGDRIDPAVELAESGRLDFLVFECLAERTIALSQLQKRANPAAGYDPFLEDRMRAVLPACRRNGTRIISNMGAANPRAAAQRTIEIARSMGLHGLRVGCVEGDDVLSLIGHLKAFGDEQLPNVNACVSANAYLGADVVARALQLETDVIITGRVADPSLFLGALVHAFGWNETAWDLLAQGTAIGHLLECAGQLTGGYFADPGYKEVPDLACLGFPLAEVREHGSATIEKVDGTGGLISLQTCREQILYEVHDPSSYVTPDVITDFTAVRFEVQGANRIDVSGARGRPRPGDYKVSVGVDDGLIAEGQISYAGPGAVARAQLARDVLQKRLVASAKSDMRFDLIGMTALHDAAARAEEPYEARLRAVARFTNRSAAQHFTREVESLYLNGPAGGAGVSLSIKENIAIVPALISKQLVSPKVSIEEA